MSLPARRLFSEDEYLLLERAAHHRSELVNGEIYAMAGASLPHNVITANVAGELRQQLKGRPCQAMASDLRVQISASMTAFPSATSNCMLFACATPPQLHAQL